MKTPITDHTLTPQAFTDALEALGWKQSDFSRRTGLTQQTPSRWANGVTPIPLWVGEYLGLLQEVQRLHAAFLAPVKASE